MVLWLIFVFLDVCKFKGILLIKQGRIRYFLGGTFYQMTDFRCFLIVFRWYLRNLSPTAWLKEPNRLLLILYY